MEQEKDGSDSITTDARGLPPARTEILSEPDDMLAVFGVCAKEASAAAIRYFDRIITYGEIAGASDDLAQWLRLHGVGRGDRVSIVLQNIPQFLMMLVATWKVGAIPVPGNPMYRRQELARIFQDCEPKVVLCLDEIVPEVREALVLSSVNAQVLVTSGRDFQTRNDPRVFSGSPPTSCSGEERLEDVVGTTIARPMPVVELDGDEIGLILYTSGTTGQPKGAMIRHRSLAFNGRAMRDFCGLGEHSRVLGIAPFFHITGMSCHIAAALSARASLVLQYRVEASLLLDIIREHRPTFTIGAITAFNALMNVPGLAVEDMASFDRIYSGGAPIPPALHAELERRFGIPVHSSYGMTETTAHTHLAPFMSKIPVDAASGALSIGKVTPFTDAKIVDEGGKVLGPGASGELLVRGPQIMVGYWQNESETAVTLDGGWMHTGDVAFFDEDGWYYLVDRIKDVIIASGFKVWPREVEDVLYSHTGVREAAVVGIQDDYRGETVKAYVSLKAGVHVSSDELIEHCRNRLAAYKAPRIIEILDELPKTATGKIQRLALREQSAASQTPAAEK